MIITQISQDLYSEYHSLGI